MPIFMIGTQRSGSNLLRLMLDQLDGIAAPHPPHILHAMMPLAGGYGYLTENGPFSALVEDVCRFVELAPIPWTDFRLDRADIARRARGRSLMAVCGAVYDAFADSRRAETWLCKSLYNVLYLPEIEKHFPKARYIHLYRDGRDVAVSFRKAPVGEKHFYHIAKQWSADQQLALAHRAAVPADRFIGVAYEDLTAHPDETMKRLCVFLGVGYRQEMLRFHESEDARRAAGLSALWGNVAAPIMAGNTRKFLQAASMEDIAIFESVAGDMLDALGYDRFHVHRGAERAFTAEDIRRFNAENRRLKLEVLRGVNAREAARLNRQEALLAEIRRRSSNADRTATLP